MNNKIQKTIEVLNAGGIVIFPTDTAFGIGCRIDKKEVIERLFKIRNRPDDQATPVLVSSISMAQQYLKKISKDVEEKLVNKYWPGGLTVIYPCQKDKVPLLVRGGGQNLGVRMPNNKEILRIIKEVGVPILGPSANFHGQVTPYRFKDLNPELISKVDYVLSGECPIKKPSTVVDCSKTPWRVLRMGAININL